jgi:hypothetical protein
MLSLICLLLTSCAVGYDSTRSAISQVFADVLTLAAGSVANGSKLIRGFVTNVSNVRTLLQPAIVLAGSRIVFAYSSFFF